jgi:syntaxin-binding protein 1
LYESAETDFVSKLLAFMVQSDLEEHKRINADFGVRINSRPTYGILTLLSNRNQTLHGREQRS